jgi:hypothetical protein
MKANSTASRRVSERAGRIGRLLGREAVGGSSRVG